MTVEGRSDYRERLVRRKRRNDAKQANKTIRESAFARGRTVTEAFREQRAGEQQAQRQEVRESLSGGLLAPLAALTGWTQFLAPDPMDTEMSQVFPSRVKEAMTPDEKTAQEQLEAQSIGLGAAGVAGRVKTLGEMVSELPAVMAGRRASSSKPGASKRVLIDAAEKGQISPGFLEMMEYKGRSMMDVVGEAARRAGLEDVPVVSSAAEAPRRGPAIIGTNLDAVFQKGKNRVNIVGKLLGVDEAPADSLTSKTMDMDLLRENVLRTAQRARELGIDPKDLHPMTFLFYKQVQEGFLEPLSRGTGLNVDELAQLGASFSPRKYVPVEMAQTVAMANLLGALGKGQKWKDVKPERAIAEMEKLGLTQLADSHTRNALNLMDVPRHTILDAENVVKTGVYGLNKSDWEAKTINPMSDLAAYTVDSHMSRAFGFPEWAAPDAGQYGRVLRPITEAMGDLAPIVEQRLLEAGFPKTTAAKISKIPNVGQSTTWHDARDHIGKALLELLKRQAR